VAPAVAVGAVAVVHRAAEGRPLLRVAVAAHRQVVAGEHPRELLLARGVAEDHRPAVAKRLAHVPGAAAADPPVAVLPGADGLDDTPEQLLLRLGVDAADLHPA